MQSTFLNWFVMETTRSIREPIRTQLIKGFGRGTMGENQHHAAELLIVHTLRETPVVEMWSSDEGGPATNTDSTPRRQRGGGEELHRGLHRSQRPKTPLQAGPRIPPGGICRGVRALAMRRKTPCPSVLPKRPPPFPKGRRTLLSRRPSSPARSIRSMQLPRMRRESRRSKDSRYRRDAPCTERREACKGARLRW